MYLVETLNLIHVTRLAWQLKYNTFHRKDQSTDQFSFNVKFGFVALLHYTAL